MANKARGPWSEEGFGASARWEKLSPLKSPLLTADRCPCCFSQGHTILTSSVCEVGHEVASAMSPLAGHVLLVWPVGQHHLFCGLEVSNMKYFSLPQAVLLDLHVTLVPCSTGVRWPRVCVSTCAIDPPPFFKKTRDSTCSLVPDQPPSSFGPCLGLMGDAF